MKINVQLHGSLREDYPEYRHSAGINIDVPDQATVTDLLTILKIKQLDRAVVICEGHLLKLEDSLLNKSRVVVLETMCGG